MKYFYLFLIVILSVSGINAQVPNSGFESWTDGEPNGWITNNLGGGFSSAVTQSGDARTGSSALKLEMINVSTIAFGGSVTSGDEQAVGFPVAQRYEALNGYFKFLPNAGSTAFSVTLGMLKNGEVIGAGGFATFTSSNSYISFSAPISYLTGDIPDTALIVMSIIDTTTLPAIAGGYVLVDDLSFGGTTSVSEDNSILNEFTLNQNYPNPFNPSTKIRYSIPNVTLSGVEGSKVQLKVYDLLGNEVATLVNEYKPAGSYEVEFNGHSDGGQNLSSGVYFYKLQAGSYLETKKMILLR